MYHFITDNWLDCVHFFFFIISKLKEYETAAHSVTLKSRWSCCSNFEGQSIHGTATSQRAWGWIQLAECRLHGNTPALGQDVSVRGRSVNRLVRQLGVCLWRRRWCFTWKKWRQSPHPAAAACRTKPRWQKARRSAPPASDASGTWISSFSQRKPCSESVHSHTTQARRCQREPTKLVECKREKGKRNLASRSQDVPSAAAAVVFSWAFRGNSPHMIQHRSLQASRTFFVCEREEKCWGVCFWKLGRTYLVSLRVLLVSADVSGAAENWQKSRFTHDVSWYRDWGGTLLQEHHANYGTQRLLPVFALLNKIDKSGLQFNGNSGYNQHVLIKKNDFNVTLVFGWCLWSTFHFLILFI